MQSDRPLNSFLMATWAGLSVFILTAAPGLTAGGPHFALDGGPKFPSGLAMGIEALGIDANGYRPLLVTVGTVPLNTPLIYDRQVRVVLGLHDFRSQKVAEVSQVIELPEGSSSVTATILVPQKTAWTSLSAKTFEGGEKLVDLSHTGLGWPNTNGWDWTEARPALLFIDSKVPARADRHNAVQAYESNAIDTSTSTLPDVRPLLSLFPDNQNNTRFAIPRPGGRAAPGSAASAFAAASASPKVTDTVLLTMIDARSRTAMISPGELPQRWIELSQYDVAIISLADLQQLAANEPKQCAALRDWLSTGPLLIVYGAGQRFERLPQLEKLLQLSPIPQNDPPIPALRGWTPPKLDSQFGSVTTHFDVNADAGAVDISAEPADSTTPSKSTLASPIPLAWPLPALPPFAYRAAGTGRVVAIGIENPFPGSRSDWDWIFDKESQSHWQWYKRNGFSLHRTNDDYWKLLIPGVGEAPVYSFLFLVSLFAVVIGPINFLLLGRARRLYLLLLTVPAGAVLVTGSLFAFAMISDGLVTRLRIRSYADLDQTTGRSAVWSRQSYYAGVAPSRGLRFPDDTTVFPVAYEPGANLNDRSTLLVWDGDQHLRDGYLSSRTAAQFIVCRATTTKVGLIVSENSAPTAVPQVENRLETFINYLLVRDSRGNYFDGKSIRSGSTAELAKADPTTAQAVLQKLASAVEPGFPHGLNPGEQNENIFSVLGIRRSRYGTSDSSLGDPLTQYSLLETNLDHATHPATHPLFPGTYIAIVETSPLIVTGIGRVREEASFHVIRGRY
jgi:hypothetical protein